jgi:hypothetical protein
MPLHLFTHTKETGFQPFSHFLNGRLSSSSILHKDENLASKTTMRVGGKALWYAEPQHTEDLRESGGSF